MYVIVNDFETVILRHAFANEYEMVNPDEDHALHLKRDGFITFASTAGRFGFVRATLTEKGKEYCEQNFKKVK